MKKLLTAILLLFMSSTLFAQGRKSLITPQMAKRTAYLVSNNMGMVRGIFQDANKLNSIRKTDEILAEIDKHPDCVEIFCIALIEKYGTGDGGYLAFKDCGFTLQEFKIAEQIYRNKRKEAQKAKEEANRKAAADEQATLEKWMKEGLPNDIMKKPGYKPAKFKMKAPKLAAYIDDELGARSEFIDKSYTIEIDKEGKMRVKPTDILLDKAQFELESPSLYEFANLKKEVFVPSNYTLKLIEKRKLAFSDKEIKIEWSKNENSWVLSKPKDVEKELGSDTYYAVRYGLLAHLNNMKELQGDKKKHTVLASAYINGSISCFLDGKDFDSYTLLNSYVIKIIK